MICNCIYKRESCQGSTPKPECWGNQPARTLKRLVHTGERVRAVAGKASHSNLSSSSPNEHWSVYVGCTSPIVVVFAFSTGPLLQCAIPSQQFITSRFLKNRRRGRQATRTLSTGFPNSRVRTSPQSATGIRADARAYTPARGGGLREPACSTAFPDQPARDEPSRLSETSPRG